MAALPMQPPHPIVYGALSRDLGPEPLPADLVVYGYRMRDPVLKAAPKVVVGGVEVASLMVADDRIAVTLPGEVKTALGFAPTPCASRLGFGLRVTGVYAQPRGIWPVAWTDELRSVSDLYVPPTPVWYAAKVRARFEAPTQTTATVPFEARSELVVADCGETRAAAVEAALPPGATDVQCVGEWVDASGAETPAARCSADGGAAAGDRGTRSAARKSARRTSSAFARVRRKGFCASRGVFARLRRPGRRRARSRASR